jgi:hypothetical protein
LLCFEEVQFGGHSEEFVGEDFVELVLAMYYYLVVLERRDVM